MLHVLSIMYFKVCGYLSDTTDLLNVDNLGIKVIKNLLPFPFCLDKENMFVLKTVPTGKGK